MIDNDPEIRDFRERLALVGLLVGTWPVAFASIAGLKSIELKSTYKLSSGDYYKWMRA